MEISCDKRGRLSRAEGGKQEFRSYRMREDEWTLAFQEF